MNWMNGDFCTRDILRPSCRSCPFLFVSNKSFVTRHFYCLRFACFRLKSSFFSAILRLLPSSILLLTFFSLAPAFGLLDEIVLQRYMLCLCPARSCPVGSSAKSPHSVSLR